MLSQFAETHGHELREGHPGSIEFLWRATDHETVPEEALGAIAVEYEARPRRAVSEPSILALLNELNVPHPLATLTQKLNLAGHHLTIEKKAFVFASGYAPSTQNHRSATCDRTGKCLIRLLIFVDRMTRASVIVGTSPFAQFANEACALGWPVEDLPTHHFPRLLMPRETAEVLMLLSA
jgi:hypothetical protein